MDIDKEEFDTKLKLKMQKIKFNPSTHIDCVMCKFTSNTFVLLSLSPSFLLYINTSFH